MLVQRSREFSARGKECGNEASAGFHLQMLSRGSISRIYQSNCVCVCGGGGEGGEVDSIATKHKCLYGGTWKHVPQRKVISGIVSVTSCLDYNLVITKDGDG